MNEAKSAADKQEKFINGEVTAIFRYLAMALAWNLYDDVEVPAKIRVFLFKKRPLPTEKEFTDFMSKLKLGIKISDHMRNRRIPNGPNDFHAVNIDLIANKKEFRGARLSSIFYRASAKDRVIALCNHNYYGFIASDSPADQLHNSYQKPTPADIQIFKQVLAALRKDYAAYGISLKALYVGYYYTLKDVLKSKKARFADLKSSEIPEMHEASKNMIVTLLTENLDGTYDEIAEYHGDYNLNYDSAINEAKELRASSRLYKKHGLFIYYSNFEPWSIVLDKVTAAKRGKAGYKHVLEVPHLDVPNTVMIVAPSKEEADKEYRLWLKEKGYDDALNLKAPAQRFSLN